jgi:riboflavin kinase/FMN adenylyltransferase
MTIGVFDGVHRGHQVLIEKITRRGPEYRPVVVTFKENPKKLLHNPGWKGDILSMAQKMTIFRDLGVGLTVLIDFSGNFSKLSGRQFIDTLRLRGNLGYLAIGGNFRCGYRLDTDAARIKALNNAAGIPTDVVEPVGGGAHPVSSSLIRGAIAAGDFPRAASLLGRSVEVDLTGVAVSRRGEGVFYDLAAQHRILPPRGRYPVLVYGESSPEVMAVEVTVVEGGILMDPPCKAARVEFYHYGTQGE